jgi:prepilin-type N-terminal cleavage/methylation domain-containing protein
MKDLFAKKIPNSKLGFTLIELLVVLAVMGILTGVMIVNIAGTRGVRDLKIAQSQLVTNLRKIQSHTLSSRNISSNIPAQFYLMKFDRNSPRQYTIQAIYDVRTAPKLADLETIKFPENITLLSVNPIEIDREPLGLSGNDQKPASCALVAFKAPFAKVIMNDGCSFANFVNDDYAKIKDFIANNDLLTASTDSIMTVKLYEPQKGTSKTVTINGVSGLISFQQ